MKISEFRMDKLNQSNSNDRSLFESVVANEVLLALQDWTKISSNGVLIGGLALSYHIKPRHTQDIDMIYLTGDDIPETVTGFRKIRNHEFQHNQTHVEVEVLPANFIDQPQELVNRVIRTSLKINNTNIASANGLVALKLGRFSRQDQADIEQLIIHANANINEYTKWLSDLQIKRFNSIMNSL